MPVSEFSKANLLASPRDLPSGSLGLREEELTETERAMRVLGLIERISELLFEVVMVGL